MSKPKQKQVVLVMDESNGEIMEVCLVRDDETPEDAFHRSCRVEAESLGMKFEEVVSGFATRRPITRILEEFAMVKLVYLAINQVWVFTFGDATLRLYPHPHEKNPAPLFFSDKYEAVRVANKCNLDVMANGDVVPMNAD